MSSVNPAPGPSWVPDSQQLHDNYVYAQLAFQRRRTQIFVAVLCVTLVIGLIINYSRPAVYQSVATVLMEPPASATDNWSSLAALGKERQRLLSAATLESVQQSLDQELEGLPDEFSLPGAMQDHLGAEVLLDTNMIQLRADGREPAGLPIVLRRWLDVYQARLTAARAIETEQAYGTLRTQLADFDKTIEAKRAAIDAFAAANNIVSPERTENRVYAQLQGLNARIEDARQAESEAAGELQAIRAAIGEGKPVATAADSRVIANLEARAQELREKLRAYEQKYTEAYRAIDPDIGAAARQLADVETELATKQRQARDAALAEAELALNSARQRVRSLTREFTAQQDQAAGFSRRYQEYEALRDELEELQTQAMATRNRFTQAQVASRDSYPQISVLEQPSQPLVPVRPLYSRDAALVAGLALLLALLAAIAYTYARRPIAPSGAGGFGATPSIFSYQTQIFPPSQPDQPQAPLPAGNAKSLLGAPLQRELSVVEVNGLLASAEPAVRMLITLLLSGLTAEQAGRLRWADFAAHGDHFSVPGDATRTLAVTPLLAQCLGDPVYDRSDPGQLVLAPLAVAGHAVAIQQTAQIAGLSDPNSVTDDALRHTFVAYLVRQGIRVDALQDLVGELKADQIERLYAISPPTPGKSAAEISLSYPATVAGG